MLAKAHSTYIEGSLLKRRRGLHHPKVQSPKFQERFFCLTPTALEYYKSEPKKEEIQQAGIIKIENIRIVEAVQDDTFNSSYYHFQVGDDSEVIYLAAKTAAEREEWMEAVRRAALDSGTEMLPHYHSGVYHSKWSCCEEFEREAPGCQRTTLTGIQKIPTNGYATETTNGEMSHMDDPIYCTIGNDDEDSGTVATADVMDGGICSVPLSHHSTNPPSPDIYKSRDEHTCVSPPHKLRMEQRQRGRLSDRFSKESGILSLPSVEEESEGELEPEELPSTPLLSAIMRRDYEKLKSLLEDNNGLNEPANRTPALHLACRQGWNDAVNLLLVHNAAIDAQDTMGSTPLMETCKNGHPETAAVLLEHGAVLNIQDETGSTPLMEASRRGHYTTVKLLLEKGAIIDLQDRNGSMPLMEACKNGHHEIAHLLIETGAEVDQEGPDQRTALHEAACSGHVRVAEILVNNGADPVARDDSDCTPHDLAFQNDHKELMHILQEAMPESVRPYTLLPASRSLSNPITTLAWGMNVLVSGSSEDCLVNVWDAADLSLRREIRLPSDSEVSAVDTWDGYLVIGSKIIQLFEMGKAKWRKITIASEDESMTYPLQHLAAFTPAGMLATVSAADNKVKLWPCPTPDSVTITQPQGVIPVKTKPGCICRYQRKEFYSSLSLSVSPAAEQPWLAIGVTEGWHSKNRTIELFNLETWQHQYTFNAGHGNSLHPVFSPDGRHIAVGCTTDLRIWKTANGTLAYKLTDSFGEPISSLCYSHNGSHLLTGLSSGKVKVFEVSDFGIISPIFTLSNSKNSSPATSMAYSKDGSLLAVGHENGILQLWRAHGALSSDIAPETTPAISPHPVSALSEVTFCNEPLMTNVREKQFDSSGGECASPEYGYKMVVPEGAIPEDTQVSIQHGVVPYGPFGPFQYPGGLTLVSPIVGFHPNMGFEFHKSIQITLPHCITSESDDDYGDDQGVVFLKARDSDYEINEEGEKIFHLREVDGRISFASDSVTLDTNHLCFFCLGVYNKERVSFCLIEAIPEHMGRETFQVCFCLCYFLNSCIETVENQFREGYKLTKKRVTFTGRGLDPGIELDYHCKGLPGWAVVEKSASKIPTKEVCFWERFGDNPAELVLACKQGVYPPRIVLEIDGKQATRNAVIEVNLKGANEDVKTLIHLQCPLNANSATHTEQLMAGMDDSSLAVGSNPGCPVYAPQKYTTQISDPLQQQFVSRKSHSPLLSFRS